MKLMSAQSVSAPVRRWKVSRALALSAALVCASGATMAASGPFTGLDGLWSGTGTVALTDGTKERMRCRAQYLVMEEGNNLQQSLRCESDTYKFHVTAYVNSKAGSLSGVWTEETRNVSGRISGKAKAGRIQISVASAGGFSAKMNLVTSGNQQTVTITPKGTEVKQVTVSARKTK